MTDSNFYFNPYQKGLLVLLGSTEAKLMEIAWEQKEITVKTALFYYSDTSKPAYTTIMTILSRLADKKLLNRKKSGRHFVYTPTISKKEFITQKTSLIKACLKNIS